MHCSVSLKEYQSVHLPGHAVIQAPRGMFTSVRGMCVLEGCTCLMELGAKRMANVNKCKHTQLTIKQKKDTRTHAIAGSLFGKAIARSSHEKRWRKKNSHKCQKHFDLSWHIGGDVRTFSGWSEQMVETMCWGQALCNAQHLEICHVNLKWMKTLTGYFPHKLMRG